jgi:ATP phosphoribosyltransferase regulatory subunit
LHTQPIGLTRTRELMQIGAELYGHSGLDSDLEIQTLLLESLRLLGVANVHLDLGHVAVFRALVQHAQLDQDMEAALFTALQSKDSTALQNLVAPLPANLAKALLALPSLYGKPNEVLTRAQQVLPDLPEIRAALADLAAAAKQLETLVGSIGIDLADLRGYHYHTGMVFAAYHAGSHDAIALGGRYDELGKSFGRARAATGFSMDLRQLYRLMPVAVSERGIYAPHQSDFLLHEKIAQLRAAGECVVIDLLNEPAQRGELQCDRELVLQQGIWQVVAL